MRHIIISSVGYRGAQVCHLQRRESHLSLTDGDAYDRQRVPIALIHVAIIRRVGNHSALLSGQVNTELVAEAHAHHVVAPCVESLSLALVLAAVAYHVVQSPAEIRVARRAERAHQSHWRGMGMASNVHSTVIETVMTRIGSAGTDDSLRHERERL